MKKAYDISGCSKVCIMPRLALSELLAIAALVRDISARVPDVMLLAKRDHVRSLRSMYEDLPNVRFKFIESWDALHKGVLHDLQTHGYRVIPLPSFREACPYALLGMNPDMALAGFQVQRHLADEHALHARVLEHTGNRPYVVVHHDDHRPLRHYLIPQGYVLINVRDPRFRTANIFDWIETIDQALELHAIDSCFLLMAECLRLRPRKYLHAYASKPSTAHRYKDVVTIFGT